jgi:autotransporter-associated beta strand protein
MDIVFGTTTLPDAMPSPRLISCILGLLLALASSQATIAAIPKADREVQTLANFPTLQKLAARNDDKLRGYLSRVSDSYRKAGYGQFAQELSRSTSFVALFGQSERAGTPAALKEARSILRNLQRTFAKNRFFALPRGQGETIPDYYSIGSLFLDNAGIALKNLTKHKNVANSLRYSKISFWLTNKGGDNFTFTGSVGGAVVEFLDFSVAGAGTLTVNAGYLSVRGESQVFSSDSSTFILVSGSLSVAAVDSSFAGTVSGTGALTKTGNGTLTLGGVNTYVGNTPIIAGTLVLADISSLSGTLVIFPQGVQIPLDYSIGSPIIFGNAVAINDVVYPAGTRIANAADSSAALPEGATLLPLPAVIRTAPSPTPSPIPAG